MATSTSDITGNSALAVRGNSTLLTTLISAAVAGSVLLAGNTYTDSTANSTPSLLYDSGSYLTYTQARLSASGANRVAATIPIPTTFSSGAMIQRLQFECGTMANAKFFTAAVTALSKNGTGGTAIQNFTKKSVGTGSSVVFSTGAIKATKGNYITVLSSSGSNATMNGDCIAKTWLSEFYTRR